MMKWINAGMASLFGGVAAVNGFVAGTLWEAERGRAWFYIVIATIWAVSAGAWALTNYFQGSINAMTRSLNERYERLGR